MSAVVESSKHGVVSSSGGCVLLLYVFPDKGESIYCISEMRMKSMKYFYSESHLTLFKCLCHSKKNTDVSHFYSVLFKSFLDSGFFQTYSFIEENCN